MKNVEPGLRIPHWSQADVSSLNVGTAIEGFEHIDDIEIFSRLLGAQMISIMEEGNISATGRYISRDYNRDKLKGEEPRNVVVERLVRDLQTPIGNDIVFAESIAVCSIIHRQRLDNLFYPRPSEHRAKPWVSDLRIVTATRLVDPNTEETKSFAGLNFGLKLWRSHRGVTVNRTFIPGVKLAKEAEGLFPRTTTF